MSDLRVFADHLSLGFGSENTWVGARGLRDGSLVTANWIQSLVFGGYVFGMHAGSVTTPIAGHAAIDADQPEAAVRVVSGVAALPVSVRMSMETGATTLAQGGMLAAVSNIDVGAGTSTAYTAFNLNLNNPTSASCLAYHTYTGNGTDPLTAGNHLDLARVSAVIDADAATSGIVPPTLKWSVLEDVAPLITQVGSILAYGEAAANTLFATILWAEFNHSDFA